MNQNLFTQEPRYQQSFKQKTKPKMNKNMILYYANCPECNESCVGETERRV